MIVRRLARPMLAAIFVAAASTRCATPPPGPTPPRPAREGRRRAGRAGRPRACWSGPTAARWWPAARCWPPAGSPAFLGVLAASLGPDDLAGHAFWEKTDPAKSAAAAQQFLKNVGLLGGLLMAAVDTAGKPGLAWRARTRQGRPHSARPGTPSGSARARGPRCPSARPAPRTRSADDERPTDPRRTTRSDRLPARRGARSTRPSCRCRAASRLTNRYLVLAALAGDRSRLRAPLRSRDTLLMAQALRCARGRHRGRRRGRPGRGRAGRLAGHAAGRCAAAAVDCGLAGTVMRFLPPVAALADGGSHFDGDRRPGTGRWLRSSTPCVRSAPDRRRRARRPAVHRPGRGAARRRGHHRRVGVVAVRLRAAAGGRALRRRASPCTTTASRCPASRTSR